MTTLSKAVVNSNPMFDFNRTTRSNKMSRVYVVFVGSKPGIYDCWEKCKANRGSESAIYCYFNSFDEAAICFASFCEEKIWCKQVINTLIMDFDNYFEFQLTCSS